MSYMYTSASAALLYGGPTQPNLYQMQPNANAYRCTPVVCPCCQHGHLLRDHKPILAERFKTKLCKNYVETGHCPYMFRCMFAHGEHELRTKEANLMDGLVTEEAIKQFKRIRYEAEKATVFSAGIVLASGRTRHDPYAESALWQPLRSPVHSRLSTASQVTLGSASTVSGGSARSSPVPEFSPMAANNFADSTESDELNARLE